MAAAAKRGEGVHNSYKEEAKKGCDVLFRVKIKGRKTLVDDIPLHMSLKIFSDPKEYDLDELKSYVKEHDICSPDPKDLKLTPIIFTAEKSKLDYYMLKIEGLPPKYKALYDHYKHVGNVYKEFMTHVTIDKALYDDLKENGIKAEDIEFGPLMVEHGSNNAIHTFDKSEKLDKGIKHVAAALGVVGAMASQPAKAPAPQADRSPAMVQPNAYSSKRMLNTISSVESQHGKFQNHKPVGGIHGGESAYGKYALMPATIRDTIHMDPQLKIKHAKAMNLRGDDMRRYMEDNPGLEDTIAQKHLSRLEHHFGQNPEKIGYAWLNGVRGTYKAGKNKMDISNHWHVKKIKDAYSKEK
jgi:hypothetical protein